MNKQQEELMNGDLTQLLELGGLTQANEDYAPRKENRGYDPYNNSGAQNEPCDEKD